ncbi:hypothetical protein FPOA_02122 [Fusarium poae]|uniref:RTA1 domain protein n=1 Tax=Fusarium poae TaxID=36050 RepID=A0A1B8B637_FUSPO|nr:hypothetical protein FPOA_02122 [Fusarium poae]
MAGSDAPQAYVFYNYNPSMVAAVIFIVVFGISSLLHTYQLARARTWYFIPFLIGCLFECVGYVGRALSANEAPNFTKNPYIIQSILLLLGPALLAASIYMVLAPSGLPKCLSLAMFCLFSRRVPVVVCWQQPRTDAVKRGENIIVGGLVIQILFFGFFMIVTLIFHVRINRNPTQKSLEIVTPWKKLLFVLYAASLSILVRSVFRVAEYVMGKDSALQSQEFWIYIFDALLMSLVVVSLNWFHPSRVINGALDRKRIVSQDEYMLEGQGYEGHRQRYSLSPVRPKN